MAAHLNLFSPRLRSRELIRSRVRLWARVTLAAALATLLMAYKPWAESIHQQALLNQCDLQAARLARMVTQSQRMKSRLVDDRKLQSAIIACEDDGVALRTMGVVGQVVREMKVDVRVREIEFSRTTSLQKPGDPKSPTIEVLNVALFGVTSDQLMITQFMTRLRDTGIFESIEARPMGAQGTTGDLRHAFRVDGKLLRPRDAAAKS